MSRPSLRAVAVATGFLAVSVVVAGTAAAMVATPDDAPVASAIELAQEDPQSRTPVVHADDSASDSPAEEAAPIEVGAPAIRCTDDGVCDGSATARHDAEGRRQTHDRPRGQDDPEPSAAARAAATRAEPIDCDRIHKDGASAWDADALESWGERWETWAQQCWGDQGAWRDVVDSEAWKSDAWKKGADDDRTAWQDEKDSKNREDESRWRDSSDHDSRPSHQQPDPHWDGAHDGWRDHHGQDDGDRGPAGHGDRDRW